MIRQLKDGLDIITDTSNVSYSDDAFDRKLNIIAVIFTIHSMRQVIIILYQTPTVSTTMRLTKTSPRK
jgi:hypothetical protein